MRTKQTKSIKNGLVIFRYMAISIVIGLVLIMSGCGRRDEDTEEATPLPEATETIAPPARTNDDAIIVSNETSIITTLADIGFYDEEIQIILELMKSASGGELLSEYTFQVNERFIDAYIRVDLSDLTMQTVNMLDFMGLNIRNSVITMSSTRDETDTNKEFNYRNNLGHGSVDGREVFALARYFNTTTGRNMGMAPRFAPPIRLYEVADNTIDHVGEIRNNEVYWFSPGRFSTNKIPLYMEIGTVYEHYSSELAEMGMRLQVFHEIPGFRNVTIGEREFVNCIALRRTNIIGIGYSVFFTNSYFYRGFGLVLTYFTNVTISGANVIIDFYLESFVEEIEPSEIVIEDDIYPFVRNASPSQASGGGAIDIPYDVLDPEWSCGTLRPSSEAIINFVSHNIAERFPDFFDNFSISISPSSSNRMPEIRVAVSVHEEIAGYYIYRTRPNYAAFHHENVMRLVGEFLISNGFNAANILIYGPFREVNTVGYGYYIAGGSFDWIAEEDISLPQAADQWIDLGIILIPSTWDASIAPDDTWYINAEGIGGTFLITVSRVSNEDIDYLWANNNTSFQFGFDDGGGGNEFQFSNATIWVNGNIALFLWHEGDTSIIGDNWDVINDVIRTLSPLR